MLVVKCIIRYVSGTLGYGIWYTFEINAEIASYFVVDWARNIDDHKSTFGGCFFIGNNLVSWQSKKQNSILLFTIEVEYIAARSCCTQLLWLKQMLVDYGTSHDTLIVYCDNSSAINISKNPV